jgi:hypothetical protein
VNKEKIRTTVESVVGAVKLRTISKARHPLFEKLERLLTHWIDCHNGRSVALSFMIFQHKALSLFEDLKKKALKEGDESAKELEFKGSHVWFERLKKLAYIHSLRLSNEAASANSEAASIYPEELQKIVIEGGFPPKQIFNADETGLFWKRMPSRTFTSRDENKVPDHKTSKDSLALLLGGNVEGDKLKPLLVYHSQNPRVLKGLNKNLFPVFWRANRKVWVTKQIFANYFSNYLYPFIAKHSAENNLTNEQL